MASDLKTREVAQLVLTELGVGSTDLHATLVVPTIAEFVPRVVAAASPATQRTYGPYWRRAVEQFGGRRLDEIRASDIAAFKQQIIVAARRRRNDRGGRSAGETAVRAIRSVYRLAVDDGWLRKADNPAARVPLGRRLRSTRHGLSRQEIADLNAAVSSGGNDPVLDSLLLRLHLETACRRCGALNLRVMDLDKACSRVLLREKGGTERWQPITPTLVRALTEHATHRGARQPTDPLLRYRNHRPLTRRRYDTLWTRIRELLPWAKGLGISAHWLRHTTLTWVEREFGYAIAHTYAGHSHDKGTTLVYTRGQERDVATALAWLTGEQHPLAGDHRAIA